MNVCLTKEQQQEEIAEYYAKYILSNDPIALDVYTRFSHKEILEEIEFRESLYLEDDIDSYPMVGKWDGTKRRIRKYWFHASLKDLYLAESFYRIPDRYIKSKRTWYKFSWGCVIVSYIFDVMLITFFVGFLFFRCIGAI